MAFSDQINQVNHGFRIVSAEDCEESGGRAFRMIHEKTGAELFWLDNHAENMVFSISFRTLPQDSTGVFHILEHSVLCGSRKYPVREPFVELLKSSMNTFLNAMTFPDMTMYPVSSRNFRDLMNLTDVYLPESVQDIGDLGSDIDYEPCPYKIHCYEGSDAQRELDKEGIPWVKIEADGK